MQVGDPAGGTSYSQPLRALSDLCQPIGKIFVNKINQSGCSKHLFRRSIRCVFHSIALRTRVGKAAGVTSLRGNLGIWPTALKAAVIVSVSLLGWQVSPRRAFGQEPSSGRTSASKGTEGKTVERGRYLVESVAMCGNCHTPPGISGEPDRSKWLMGAPLGVTPIHPDPNWPETAPRLAGTPPGTDAEMIALLTTGIWKTGKPLRPPMPRFHMSREDASAVIAYLKSVTPAEPAAFPTGNK